GLSYGEEASRVAVRNFIREYANSSGEESIPARLNRSLAIANTAVFDLAYNGRDDYDLGTTLVATAVFVDQLFWISVGDSRIYLFRDEELNQLTNDHIYANHLDIDVENGKISRDEANNHPE
ncbi:MAG: serine/threonine protein phosphatase, partial [Dethiobacteria bacterium]|nr:serine/threonine protein phosphatase [Dethiobacteria bacterium]